MGAGSLSPLPPPLSSLECGVRSLQLESREKTSLFSLLFSSEKVRKGGREGVGEGERKAERAGEKEREGERSAGVKYFRNFCHEDFITLSPPGLSQSARVPGHLRPLRQDSQAERMQAPCELGAI